MISVELYEDGGMIDGPDHEQGGVAAVNPEGEQVAEVEGGERIFSQKDTREIETLVTGALSAENDDRDMIAQKLGYRIIDMVIAQKQRGNG